MIIYRNVELGWSTCNLKTAEYSSWIDEQLVWSNYSYFYFQDIWWYFFWLENACWCCFVLVAYITNFYALLARAVGKSFCLRLYDGTAMVFRNLCDLLSWVCFFCLVSIYVCKWLFIRHLEVSILVYVFMQLQYSVM